ncbi:MAG: SPOR domain-containing protein [Bacillota bacterium]|nr:MAG: SPOR domain-containing protein [Bacillota bacterium]
MGIDRRGVPLREPARSRGPRGVTVFFVFLILAALCIGAGFTVGRYILSTLSDTMADPADTSGDTGGSGGTGGTGGDGQGGTDGDTGGDTGGAIPAGGGAGNVICDLSPLPVYAIQVGAFGSRANADKVVSDLAAKGYPGHVLSPASGSTLYKVWTVTVTKRDVAEAVRSRLKTQGYQDCFVAGEDLDTTALTLSGSSLDYLNKAKTAIEVLSSCLRIEGDIWDKYHSGSLDRAAATTSVDALLTTVSEAKAGLARFVAPQDLAPLGQTLDELLQAALANLEQVKSYLTSQRDADRIAAESSFISLVDRYARLGASLRR